jgi:hypothetical protein
MGEAVKHGISPNPKALSREGRQEKPPSRQSKIQLFLAAFAAFLCDLGGQKLFLALSNIAKILLSDVVASLEKAR